MSYYGIYQGKVVNVKDPEKRGRIKVICPEVLGATSISAWCDPVVPVAYDNGGDFFIPPKNEMVWILFIAGDIDRPVYLGGWWSEKTTPLGDNYSNINDLRIVSFANCAVTLKKDKITIKVGNTDNVVEIKDGNITIEGSVKVNGTVTAEDFITDKAKFNSHVHTGYNGVQSSEPY